jgi:leader peptidase (prepilin peptidase) / N-methyltransferase
MGHPYTSGVPPSFVFELLGFILGLFFGSFLNVCIVRFPKHESIVTPRSHCMTCGHTVRWYDNVPVLSWAVLRGRCRDCGAGISWRYPAVELAVAVWFARVASDLALQREVNRPDMIAGFELIFGNKPYSVQHRLPDLLGIAILGFLLIGLMVMDWQTLRLPDAFTLSGIGIGFALVCVRAFFLAPGEGDIVLNSTHQLRLSSPGSFTAQGNVFLTGTEALIMGRIAAIAGAALLLLTVRWIYRALRKQDGMGLGDVKLLAMIAAFLGFGQSLLALFAGVVAASLYGVALIARRKAGGATRLPFGSFLAAGGLFAALFGAGIVDWYVGLLR